MTALESLQTRLEKFKVNYVYNPLFSYEENRGAFLTRLISQMIGNYAEQVMPEYDLDPESKFLGAGKKTDWENSKFVFELKKNPPANNGSSKKSDVPKLINDAKEKGKTPIYAYWEDRPKNDWVGKTEGFDKGLRYVHGSALFKLLGYKNYKEQYNLYLDNINNIFLMIKEDLTNKFDEKFQSFNKSAV